MATQKTQEILENLGFSKKMLKSEKVVFEDSRILFPISNKRGVENNFIIELEESDTLSKATLEESHLTSILGINSLTEQSEDVYIVSSPLDRLSLLSIGINQVICIEPSSFESKKEDYIELLFNKYKLNSFLKIIIAEEQLYDINQYISEEKGFKLNLFKVEQEINKSLNSIKEKETTEIELDHIYQIQTLINEQIISDSILCHFIKNNIEHFPIIGVVELDEEVESFIDSAFANGIQKGVSTGYDNLDQYLRPKTKNMMLVYGIPSHGKSLFVKNLCLNLAKTSGWKTGFFVPEEEDATSFYMDLIEKNMGKLIPFYNGNVRNINNDKYYQESKRFVKEHAKYIKPINSSQQEEDSLNVLLDTFKKAVKLYNLKCLVIDPWNRLFAGKPKHYSESEFLTIRLNQLNNFAQELDVFIIMVSHPKITPMDDKGNYKIPTLYDVNGGAQWYNMFSLGVCVYRLEDKNSVSLNLNKIQTILIQKVKRRSLGKIGVCFLTTLDNSETLIDAVDSNAFQRYLESGMREKTDLKFMIHTKKANIQHNTFVETVEDLNSVVKTELKNKNDNKQSKKNNSQELPF